jgi:hypothetical protein
MLNCGDFIFLSGSGWNNYHMNGYSQFVSQLDAHLKAYRVIPQRQWKKESIRFVNGLAAEELRHLVDLEKRREYGAFFTNSELAYQLITNPRIKFGKNCTVYDPAVGAGNLLIAAYKALYKKTGKLTLLGTDLHAEFIQASQLRLKITGLLADATITETGSQPSIDLEVADGLKENAYYTRATHIITNPPFNLINGDKSIHWGKGKLSAAAVFIDRIIRYTKPGTPIIAVLPDVLRSGSRYEKWRTMVDEYCNISELTMLGQFDKYTDIDVFSVLLTKKEQPEKTLDGHIWTAPVKTDRIVEDLFEVSVGNVVDNRDPHEGILRPFLVSRGLAGWSVVTEINKKRQFTGRSISGPFVVVKRTSRMGDKHRAVATIVNTDCPIYVDNHLIVLKPRSGKLADCHFLIKKLESNKTDNWVNEQIRCRHLTVKIVTRIPL